MSGASDTPHPYHSSKVGDNFRSELSSGMRTGTTTHKVQDLPRQGNRIIPELVTPKQDTNARHFTVVTPYCKAFRLYTHSGLCSHIQMDLTE